jgi:hypothetical protein
MSPFQHHVYYKIDSTIVESLPLFVCPVLFLVVISNYTLDSVSGVPIAVDISN